MRFKIFLCFLCFSLLFTFLIGGCSKTGKEEYPETGKLVIYTYDSFASDWGPGPVVIPAFEKKTGISVELLALGDAGQALSRVIMEKDDPGGDIILGIDNNMLPQALAADVLVPYKSDGLKNVRNDLIFDKTGRLTPYDYGNFAIIYDSEAIEDPPESLEELASGSQDRSVILMDPRTSSPGFGFLLWTIAEYGDGYAEYWKRLRPKILTVTDGWDSGYGLFTAGEAPMVLSYTTSPAYHVEYEETDRYRAAVFANGNYGQIEGLGIIKGGPNPGPARAFVDFVLSPDFQKEIPLTNWMYPVINDVVLPESFDYAPAPDKTLLLDAGEISEKRAEWIDNWTKIMTE